MFNVNEIIKPNWPKGNDFSKLNFNFVVVMYSIIKGPSFVENTSICMRVGL